MMSKSSAMQSESFKPGSGQPAAATPGAAAAQAQQEHERMENYRTQIVFDLSELPEAEWDTLVAAQPGATPFLRHAFLHAMHASGSAGDETGWSPRYLTLWAPRAEGGERLAAAMPLYAKSHSYGEYGLLCTAKSLTD